LTLIEHCDLTDSFVIVSFALGSIRVLWLIEVHVFVSDSEVVGSDFDDASFEQTVN